MVNNVKGVTYFNTVHRVERRKQIHSYLIKWENFNLLRLSEKPNEVRKRCKY